MSGAGRPSIWSRLALPLVLAVIAVAYAPLLERFFVQDDFWFIAQLHSEATWTEILAGRLHPDYLRPLPTSWCFRIQDVFWGVEPFGHRLGLLLLFVLGVGLLLATVRRATGDTLAAATAALLYGFSSSHVYVLGWVAGIIETALVLFTVLVLYALVGRRTRRAAWSTPLALFAFGCGLLSKESALLLAPIIAFSVLWDPETPWRTRWRSPLLWGTVLLALLYMTAKLSIARSAVTTFGPLQIEVAPSRGLTVLFWGIAALSPAAFAVPAVAWIARWRRPRQGPAGREHGAVRHLAGLAALLALANAAMFTLMPHPPSPLRSYYASQAQIGGAVLVGLGTAWLLRGTTVRRGPALAAVAAALLGLVVARVRIANNDAATLHLEQMASSLYHDLEGHFEAFDRFVVHDCDETRWWALGKGEVLSALRPDKRIYFVGFETQPLTDFLAGPGRTLELRVVGNRLQPLAR